MKHNPYTSKAIQQAKILRQLVLKMNERDKTFEADADEAEAELLAKKDSTDYPAKKLNSFFKEDYDDKGDAWEPKDLNEEILFLCDRILYKLMAYDADDEAWIDADDVETKEILKLKEIVDQDKKFHLKYLLLPTAA